MTDPKRTAEALIEHGFGYHQSHAIAKTEGRCAYCGVDVLSDPFKTGYAVDHILPKDTYRHLQDSPDNLAFSCWACNSFKLGFNPLSAGEDAKTMITTARQRLIERCRRHIRGKRAESNRDWWDKAREIVRS